jgi:hypothetical protein
MQFNMKKWANIFLACTLWRALQDLRPGATFYVDLASSTWVQTTDPRGIPADYELLSAMYRCEDDINKTSGPQIQADVFNLQNSTNTVIQKLPALIDLLKIRGLLQ